jgi:hypothetical protein
MITKWDTVVVVAASMLVIAVYLYGVAVMAVRP